MMTNDQISTVLREMAALYEIRSVPFKPQAYEKAAMGVDDMDEDLAVLYKSRGVEFVREPSEQPHGTVAVFRDLYGNLWDLIQPSE